MKRHDDSTARLLAEAKRRGHDLRTATDLEAVPLAIPLRDAARMFSISERTLWSLTAPRGPIPCVRLGRSVRYSIAVLQRYLETGRAKP